MSEQYEIKNRNSELYLPRVPFWIMDDLHLNLQEAMLYSMVLQKGFLTWNSEYIAKVLRCSGRTILRCIDRMYAAGVLEKSQVVLGSRKRNVLVALYTEKGRREDSEVRRLLHQGIIKLRALDK